MADSIRHRIIARRGEADLDFPPEDERKTPFFSLLFFLASSSSVLPSSVKAKRNKVAVASRYPPLFPPPHQSKSRRRRRRHHTTVCRILSKKTISCPLIFASKKSGKTFPPPFSYNRVFPVSFLSFPSDLFFGCVTIVFRGANLKWGMMGWGW